MKNVLLIDDDKTTQFLHKLLLQKLGIPREKVQSVDNGKEGIEYLTELSLEFPDIIFLDLNMPIMDGFGFLQRFQTLPQERRSAVKIIVLSSSCYSEDIKKALDLGATHFVTKPLLENNLRDIL